MITTIAASVSSLAGCLAIIADNHVQPVVTRAPKCYPFVGAKACKAALDESPAVRRLMWLALFHCQTPAEQQKQDTEVDNSRGFMSSDAWHGSRIAKAMLAGDPLNAEDEARIDRHATKYSKQMAAMLRGYAMGREPELAVSARVFGV